MSKAIQIVDKASEISWARIVELTAVDKTCSHNQDSIEICWTQIAGWD